MANYKKITLLFFFLLASVSIAFFFASEQYLMGFRIAIIPFAILSLLIIIEKPFSALIILFIVNYFILGLSRYVPSIQAGVVFDIFTVLCLLSLVIKSITRKVEWKRGINLASILSLVWVGFCVLELFNPQAVSNLAWIRTIRGVAFYFFIIIFLTCIICTKYSQVKTIIMIWSVFSILAVLKAAIQRYFGFDFAENRWLFEEDGASTHIIGYGVRYFSFFSDAANFGSSIGQSLVVFSILGLFEKKRGRQIYYFIVAFIAAYGLLISGTRGALAVPLGGLAAATCLSKNVKAIIIFAGILVATIGILKFTTLGNSYTYIRRMRSAFDSEDASLNVRKVNQVLLRSYLKGKPFGAGIGHGGVKAKKYTYSYLSTIPTDSWFVMIWVETGIVGLILHIAIWLIILVYGSVQILFKLKNPEVRCMMVALLAGITGILATSYGNEILGQFPTSTITYMSVAFIMMSKYYDKELSESNQVIVHND